MLANTSTLRNPRATTSQRIPNHGPIKFRHPLAFLLAFLLWLARVLLTWQDRVNTRTALSEMPRHRRADVGLDQAMIRRETAKPFWRD